MTIETRKPFGPKAGIFSSTGAMSESGSFLNSSLILEDVSTPDSVTVHVTQRFEGALGTFTLRAAISQTASGHPRVLSDHGSWVVIGGTESYETLRGRGRVTGTADDALDLIRRTYSGRVSR